MTFVAFRRYGNMSVTCDDTNFIRDKFVKIANIVNKFNFRQLILGCTKTTFSENNSI